MRLQMFALFLFITSTTYAANTKGLLPELKLSSDNEEKNQQKAFESEILITQSETKAIDSLKKIIKRKANTREEPDLLYRLAELYMRRSKSGRYFDLDRSSEARLKQFGLSDQKTTAFLRQALKVYGEITQRFPNFPELDYVIFNSALANMQLKDPEKSKKLYTQLIDKFPNSRLLPDALLELGEIYYNQQNFISALARFKSIEKFPQSRAYPYALYKAAWCYYNLKNTEEGIRQLVSVLKQNPAGTTDEKKYNLRKESLRDLTLFVGESLAPDQIYAFFEKLTTEDELGDIILALASLYESHSRFQEISIFTKQYIAKHPENAQTPKCYTKLIETNETLKKRELVLQSLTDMGNYCKSLEKNSSCTTEFRKVSLDISKKWWDIWLKNKENSEFSNLTRKAFENLLATDTPAQPDSQSRYAFAELLFQQQDFETASQNYEQVSLHNQATASLKHDALYAALFSLEKSIEKHNTTQKIEKQKSLGLRYLNEFKLAEHSDEIQYKMAFIYYTQKDYETSLSYSSGLVKNAKNENIKVKAQDLTLDIYNIKKDYVRIQELAKEIVKKTIASERQNSLNKIIEEAHYAHVQVEIKNLPVEKQIEQYVEFSQQHQQSTLGKEAFWQSIALAYAKDRDVVGADLSMKFIKMYPDDKRNLDALKEAVKSYTDSGNIKLALIALKQLSLIDATRTVQHTEVICSLLQIDNQLPEARNCYRELISKTVNEKKVDFLVKLMKSYSDTSSAEYLNVQNQIFSSNIEPYTTQILIRRAQTFLDQKNYEQAFSLSLKINARNVDADVRAAARIIQANILEHEFVTQSIKTNESKLALVLAMKTEKLDKAFTAYSSAVKMSKTDHVQLQGLNGIDRLYTHFIDSIANIPLPPTLNEADKSALKQELSKLTEPFKEKRTSNREQINSLSKLTTSSESSPWAESDYQQSVIPQVSFPTPIKLKPLFLTEDNSLIREINSYLQAKKIKEAEEKSLLLASNKKTRAFGLYYLSLIADSRDELQKSLWLAEKAIGLSNQKPFIYQKAKVLYSVEGLNTALLHFEKLLDTKNTLSDFQFIAVYKALSDRDYLKATDEFSRLSLEQIYTYGMDTLHIESVLQKGEIENAFKLISQYKKMNAENLPLLLEEARVYEKFLAQPEKAIPSYEKALKVAKLAEQQNWLRKKIDFIKLSKPNQKMSYVGGQ